MTKKDFIVLARIFKKISEDTNTRHISIELIAKALKNEYPRFDIPKFLVASGIK